MAGCLKPICTENHVSANNFLSGIIAKPARKSLEKEKINSLVKLSEYSEKELLQMHGFGKNTVEKLKLYMKENHLSFKNY